MPSPNRRPAATQEYGCVIDGAVLLDRSDDPQGHPHHQSERQGHQAQNRRNLHTLPNDLRHRPVLVLEGHTQVTVEGIPGEREELLPDRLVQAVLALQLLPQLRRDRAVLGVPGTPRDQVHEDERDEGYKEEDRG